MENSNKSSFGVLYVVLTSVALVIAVVALIFSFSNRVGFTLAQGNPTPPANANSFLSTSGITNPTDIRNYNISNMVDKATKSASKVPPDSRMNPILAELRVIREKGAVLAETEDAQGTADYYASNGILMVGGTSPLIGREQIKSFYQFFYSVFDIKSLDFVDDGVWYVSPDGNLVANYVDEILTLQNRFTQEEIVVDIDLAAVFERKQDKWYLVFEQPSKRVPLL